MRVNANRLTGLSGLPSNDNLLQIADYLPKIIIRSMWSGLGRLSDTVWSPSAISGLLRAKKDTDANPGPALRAIGH